MSSYSNYITMYFVAAVGYFDALDVKDLFSISAVAHST